METLKSEMESIRARVGSKLHTVNGKTSNSEKDCELWARKVGLKNFDYFVDCNSMLELIQNPSATPDQIMKTEYHAGRNHYTLSVAASIAASLKMEIPSIFGRSQNPADARKLPALRSYEDWESGNLTMA